MRETRHKESGGTTEEINRMLTKSRWLVIVFVLALVATACTGSDADDTTTTEAPTTTTTLGTTTTEAAPTTTEAPETTTTEPPPPPDPAMRSLVAPEAAITVDGDLSDWSDIVGLAMTLEPIVADADKAIDNKDVTIKMAHDGENIYALFTVDDDYNWVEGDVHASGAVAFMFPVDTG
ncbi:MAG: hypothetical protein V3S38_06780, partial [Acidimicrobiia bacterium]